MKAFLRPPLSRSRVRDWGHKQLAPQAGFEPATLRLTGEKRSVSRPLRRCAPRCRIERSLVESGAFRPSLCAAACFRLLLFVAAKGQEKGNTTPVTSFPSTDNASVDSRTPTRQVGNYPLILTRAPPKNPSTLSRSTMRATPLRPLSRLRSPSGEASDTRCRVSALSSIRARP